MGGASPVHPRTGLRGGREEVHPPPYSGRRSGLRLPGTFDPSAVEFAIGAYTLHAAGAHAAPWRLGYSG